MQHIVLPRYSAVAFQQLLTVQPVAVLTGARQTGKSTLVRQPFVAADRLYLTLDDIDVRNAARDSPDDLVRRAPRMTIDEVQRAPDVLLAIKRVVDEGGQRQPGQFAVTGSANLALVRHVADTLAGRAGYLTIWPLTRREQLGRGSTGIWDRLVESAPREWFDIVRADDGGEEGWTALAARGGLPRPAHFLRTATERATWFDGYVKTYLERDVPDLRSIEHLPDFRRLMRAVALRIGGLVNQTDLARDVGLTQPTVHRYLNVLEASYQLVRVPAYAVNRTKRLIKTPKMYWSDVGLVRFLAGDQAPTGAHLENLILCDLLAWRGGQLRPPEVLYWRSQSGAEVDFVIEHQHGLLPIEVKATTRPSTKDVAHLSAFIQEYAPDARAGLLLHTGTEVSWIAKQVLAVPWWRVV
jgi:predicted AAA+ superfamily ATPase